MKSWTVAAAALILGARVALPANSATVEILPYFSLKAGQWAIYQRSGSAEQSARVTTEGTNGQIVQTWYFNRGSGWEFDGSEIFKVKDTEILYLGSDDGTATWLFDPPGKLPRTMTVNRPVFFDGVLRNQTTGASQRTTFLFMVTRTGLAVETPAGAFTNCIKWRGYSYKAGQSRDSVSLSCKGGKSEAKSWYNKLRDTADPQVESQYSSTPSVLIQYGSSNPPIP